MDEEAEIKEEVKEEIVETAEIQAEFSQNTVIVVMESSKAADSKWKNVQQKHSGKVVDFQVRVHVIEARDLKPRDENGMSDPVCFVTVANQKKNTITHKKTTICTWDHLMFWELKATPEEFFRSQIKVSVFDANTVKRDVEIGTFELDTKYIYDSPNHEIYRSWLVLYDSTGTHSGVQGYLRISAVILAPGDAAPAHNEAEEDDESSKSTDLQSMVLVPPSIAQKSCSLDISFFKGDSLPKMDSMGKCDGYVAVKFGGHDEIKTEVQKNTYTPVWQEKISIPTKLPTMADVITLQVRDWDKESKEDDIVATEFLSLSDIQKKSPINWSAPRWVNLYGTNNSDKLKTAEAKKVNQGYLEGSEFRGRILISADLAEVSTSSEKPAKTLINGGKDPLNENWTLRVDILEGSEIQSKGDCYVEVSIGSFMKETKKAKVENGTVSWYSQVEDLNFSYPQDKSQIPDLFINVFNKQTIGADKRIGYLRIKASEIDQYNNISWNMLKPDLFNIQDQNQVAGFILFKASLLPTNRAQTAPRSSLVKPNLKKYVLRAHIYQARDLPAADNTGFSDPYCVVRLGKASQKTKKLEETLFPIWYETITLNVDLPEDLNTAPDVHVAVFDWDSVTSDDYLGRFRIPVSSIKQEFDSKPKWYSLYLNDPSFPQGEVLASFQLMMEENLSKFPTMDISPKTRDCTLEVDVINLRNLLPVNLFPAMNPFIEFDTGIKNNRVKTKSSNKPNGANPVFLQTVSFPVKVPEEKIFSPPLNIRVVDDRGLHKPLLGARSVSLTPFIPWLKEEAQTQLENLKPPVALDSIPGAIGLQPEPEPQVKITLPTQPEVVIDVNDGDERQPLINEEKQHNQKIQDAVSRLVQKRDPNFSVKESYLKGAEEEKVEENKRETVKTELEFSFTEHSFNVYKMFRGKKVKGKPVQYESGEFKGKITLQESSKPSEKKDVSDLFKPTDYIVRVYILEGFQLVPKDADGNNPYIIISNGKQKISDVDNKKQTTSRPLFYKMYEFTCTFPYETNIDIEVWDWDKTGDDLIGSTSIDLESRLLNPSWKKKKLKPIEYRTLWNPSSSNAQGQISMWVDIFTPEEAKLNPPESIKAPIPKEYELRVIVYETRKVALKDNGKASDIFIVCYPEGENFKPQNSDTHWKSKDGTGLFNWRFKYPIILPIKGSANFKIQVWDQDVLNPNDAICEANINLKALYNRIYKKDTNREAIEAQWISMTHPAASGVQGEVYASFEIVSADEARAYAAGFGRAEPNMNPHLDEPKRPEESFAPWNVKKQGEQAVKKARSKIMGFFGSWKLKVAIVCCCILSVIIIIIILKFAFAFF